MSLLPPLRVELDSRVTPAPFTDTFDRANSTNTLGNGWTVLNGTWGISNNAAYVSATAGFQNRATRDLGWSSGTFAADCSGSECGIVVRSVDAGTYLQVIILPSGAMELSKWAAGALTVLRISGSGLAVAGRMSVTVDGSLLTASYAGVEYIRYFLTSAEMTTYGAATKHGMRLGNTTARLDNFTATAKQADDPWTMPPSWVRIDVENGIVEYHNRHLGAERPWDLPPVGELVLTLNDQNRWLDPSNPASPLIGLLTPGRQLRVVYDDGVTSFTKAHGLVERWPVEYVRGSATLATTTLVVQDRMSLLAQAKLPPTHVEWVLNSSPPRFNPQPFSLFTFREAGGGPEIEYANSAGGPLVGIAGGDKPPESATGEVLLPYGPQTSGGLKADNAPHFLGGLVQFPDSILSPDSPGWGVAVVIRASPGKGIYGLVDGNVLFGNFQLGIRQVGYASGRFAAAAAVRNTAGTLFRVSTPDTSDWTMDDGAAHLIVMTRLSSDGAIRLYVDGTFIAGTSITGNLAQPVNNAYFTNVGTGSIGMVATWDNDLPTVDHQRLPATINRPLSTSSAATRLELMMEAAYDAVEPALVTSGTPPAIALEPQTYGSRVALTAVGALVVAMRARLWAKRDGTLALRYGAPPPATLSVGGTGVPYRDVLVSDRPRPASITVSNDTGAERRSSFADDTGDAVSVDVGPVKASALLATANWLYDTGFNSSLAGVTEVVLSPVRPDVGWSAALGVELYARHAVTYKRPDGTSVTEDREVCAVYEDATTTGWTTRVRYRRVEAP